MTHRSYADQLEAAASDIGNLSTPELQAILRRAAIRLRNAGGPFLGEEIEMCLELAIAEVGITRHQAIRRIVMDWMVSTGTLPVDEINEGGEAESKT